ncbi:hypothetical protein ACFL3D_05220 [Candidatus Omnitrophota bacterium]
MKVMIGIMILCSLVMINGCAQMHDQVEESSQVVGSVAALPQTAMQGVATGYVDTGSSQPNPYNR